MKPRLVEGEVLAQYPKTGCVAETIADTRRISLSLKNIGMVIALESPETAHWKMRQLDTCRRRTNSNLSAPQISTRKNIALVRLPGSGITSLRFRYYKYNFIYNERGLETILTFKSRQKRFRSIPSTQTKPRQDGE